MAHLMVKVVEICVKWLCHLVNGFVRVSLYCWFTYGTSKRVQTMAYVCFDVVLPLLRIYRHC